MTSLKRRITIRERIWHFAYCHWFDNDRAGHPKRAAFWGWVNDTLCVIMWPMVRKNGTRRFT